MAINCYVQLVGGADFKEKGNTSCTRDAIIAFLVRSRREGQLTTTAYFQAIVKANQDFDLVGKARKNVNIFF